MSMEGYYAARSVSEIGADGDGKAGGSNAQKLSPGPESLLDVQPDNGNFQSSAGPDSLDIQPDNGAFRSSSPDSALPERELHEPADQPAQISILGPEATKRPDPEDRAAAREERIDALERDGGSELPGLRGEAAGPGQAPVSRSPSRPPRRRLILRARPGHPIGFPHVSGPVG